MPAKMFYAICHTYMVGIYEYFASSVYSKTAFSIFWNQVKAVISYWSLFKSIDSCFLYPIFNFTLSRFWTPIIFPFQKFILFSHLLFYRFSLIENLLFNCFIHLSFIICFHNSNIITYYNYHFCIPSQILFFTEHSHALFLTHRTELINQKTYASAK